MAVESTVFQSSLFSGFILPFFLIFFIVFALLEKFKVIGDNKQVNAFVAAIVGFIFIGATEPKLLVANFILLLSVGIIILFVGIILWGFVNGDSTTPLKIEARPKKLLAWIIGIAMVLGLIFFTGANVPILNGIKDFLFGQNWSGTFWTNVLFIGLIVIVLVIVMKENIQK